MTEAVVCMCSIETGFFRRFAKFTGKHLNWSLFSKKIGDWMLEAYRFVINRLQHSCFSVNFAKFLKTSCIVEYLRTVTSERCAFHVRVYKAFRNKYRLKLKEKMVAINLD